MNFIKLVFLSLLLSVCVLSCKKKRKELPVVLNPQLKDSLVQKFGNKIAILSCLRCECFLGYFNKDTRAKKEYALLTDTNCNKLSIPVHYFPNRDIERLSDNIYNLTLIKLEDNITKLKILDAGDEKNTDREIKAFFDIP